MLIAIAVLLTAIFWISYVVVYFWKGIYAWFDNRFGPVSRPPPIKRKAKRRFYD